MPAGTTAMRPETVVSPSGTATAPPVVAVMRAGIVAVRAGMALTPWART